MPAALPFPAESCVTVEWNPAQLAAFIRQQVNNNGPTGVNAGVHCLSCSTCIEVTSDGRIVAINQSEPC